MLKLESKINIKVVSVGNRGCNVLERLNKLKKNGVEFCAISKAGKAFTSSFYFEISFSYTLSFLRRQESTATI